MRLAHDFPFDPTYGYELDDLLAVSAPDAPEDFDEFWRDRYAEARCVDVEPHLGPLEAEVDGVRVYGVTFATTGGLRLGGWLAIPEGPVEHGVVVSHGYGGREAIDCPLPLPGAATIFPCARGLGARSRIDGIADDPMRHVLRGIRSRDSYILGGCAADVWCAATALLELLPSINGPLAYAGGSFGGGVGALALPWDDRFGAAHLSVPSFGQYPLRLSMACAGSGAAVRAYHAGHPDVLDVLRYFDAATAASRISIPVQVAAAVFDPAVPPPGQFAVHNALSGPRDLVVLTAGHFVHTATTAEEAALATAQQTFLTSQLGWSAVGDQGMRADTTDRSNGGSL